MEDYKIMRVVVKAIKGLISQGDRIIKSGQNLSDVKIKIEVPGGAYADFCKWVDTIKEVDEKHNFGYESHLKLLRDFRVGNWAELVAKCNMLLPIAEQLRNELEPIRRIAVDRRRI